MTTTLNLRQLYRSNSAWRRVLREDAARRYPKHGRLHWRINDRADLAGVITRYAEDGKIAVIRSGMDCDCTQYYRATIIDVPQLFAWQRDEDEHQQWLDGPESTSFARPSETEPRYASSDRALEAYEDGHPGYVTWTDL